MYFFIKIIFMIIKNFVKIQRGPAFQGNINFALRKTLQLTNLNFRPAYFFSDKQPDNRNDQKNKSPFYKFLNSNKQKFSESYLKKMGQRNHLFNGPLLKRLKSLNKMINLANSWKKNDQKDMYTNFIKDQIKIGGFKYFFILLSFLIFIYDVVTRQDKSIKVTNITDVAKEMQKDYSKFMGTGKSKFQQIISTIKKVYIIEQEMNHNFQNYSDEKEYNVTKSYYKIRMEDKNGKIYQAYPYQGDPNNILKYIQMIQEKYHVAQKAIVITQNKNKYLLSDAFNSTLGFLTPFIPVLITIYIFRKMDPTSMLKNLGTGVKQFKIEAMKDINIRFKDVAGMEQAKKQITQFVDFLKNNQKFKDMGAKIPKGALLTGPPGTGKTMLAKACAGQAGVSFFYISGSQFVEVFVGLGASKVRDLFAKARQNAPSIIFIDQIDAIGKKRQTSRNEQKDTTLNQLLVEMDGFSSNQTVIVLAATNRKEILDNALTRPGRFDRMVQITLPDVKARQQIFMVHLAPLKIDPNTEMRVIAKRLSELSPGFSGADIANLCNEAAIIATRREREFIIDKDFQEATQRITAGYIKKGLMNEKNKKRVAYHEAGHAVSSWFLKGGDPLVKLTIIPRSKGSLGYAQYLPKTSYIMARNQLTDKVAIMLGGITSEQIFFGEISSGGSDDLQKVYSLTRKMVTQFGMGKQTYNITIDQQSYIQKQSTFLSDKMQEQINDILQEARVRSKQILLAKKEIIQNLAKQLMTKESLNSEQIAKIMGERPDFDGSRAKKQQQSKQQKEEKKQQIKTQTII